MAKYLPRTSLGSLAAMLVILSYISIICGVAVRRFVYGGSMIGDSISQDIYMRPALVIILILGFLSGVGAWLVVIFSMMRYKESSLTAQMSLLLSIISVFFLFIVLVFPV